MDRSPLVLRELTPQDEHAFLMGFREFDGEEPHWYSFSWKPGMLFGDHLERLRKNKAGIEMPNDRVPDSMLYGFVDGVIVGRLNIRHELNDYLRTRGGHIGYAVAPKFRSFGFATEMLQQSLPFCKAVGLDRVMVTCDDDNIPSWRVIEKCGGVLEETVRELQNGKLFRRYWITP